MYYQTRAYQYARTLVNAILACLAARPAAALLTTPTVILYSNNVSPTPDSVVADFTVANFSGYASQALTLSGPVNLASNTNTEKGSVTFAATTASPFVSQTVYGYIVTDGVSAYYGGEKFASPVGFGQAGDFLQIDLAMPEHINVSVS